jgi:hypothetical protein
MIDRETVNSYLRRFGQLVHVDIDPLDDTGYTAICRGQATVGINVVEDHGLLMLISPIMGLPAQRRLELYARLLELNFLTTSDAAFAIDREHSLVCLRALRGLQGLDFEEFVDLLDTVATTADQWQSKLVAEFGDGAIESDEH